ncbi:MAG: uroporphyrinogen decarboxylase [Ignavibacterium sp.]|nr:uroporphyrinogen decarboxylase [Ignavibacterium sp.]MCX7610644.1 uroporphyrinogen decarboxylase [Ignavibacterium sp.]MDW8375553.1 uroporphyrinogen decarboxylase [Ignavibacteriales bacterium]
MNNLKNDIFIKACKRLPTERTPIWIMRQAGRYLPEYRAIREKYDFLTMCKTPEVAAEVTIQPIDILDVDAAILFSDILVVPEAMGMKLEMHEGKGPIFENPIRSESDFNKLKSFDPSNELKYVLDAVKITKRELNNRVPLIGFSGSPWTLLCYMVEGKGTKDFANVKKMLYTAPSLAHKILSKLSNLIAEYLSAKIENGCDAVQIFDTWGGILSQSDYLEFDLQYIHQTIQLVKRTSEPIIVFSKGVHHNFDKIVSFGADVIGLDWTLNLTDVRRVVEDKVALQGNLDPTVLYANQEKIKIEAIKVLESYGYGNGHIFNLGHGILPNIEPENVKALVRIVKEESKKFHSRKDL